MTAEAALVPQVADPTLRAMIGTDEALLPVVSVLAGTGTATGTAREVHAATTTTTGPGTDRLLVVDLSRSTRFLPVVMTTPTAETTRLPTHM